MSAKIDSPIYPVVAWRIAVGNAAGENRVALLEIGYAMTFSETRASQPGGPPPLGLTVRQCRDLAADLIDAANKADGGLARQ